MRKVLIFILTLTFFVSVFFIAQDTSAEMVESSPGSYEYFEDVVIIDIQMGYDHSGAITEYGELFMWGYNHTGQLGTGDTIDIYLPKDITPHFNLSTGEKIVQVEMGDGYTIVLTSNNRVFSFGGNSYGQLGTGTFDTELLPVDITSQFTLDPLDKIVSVYAGNYHAGAISEMGEVFLWGTGEDAINGDPTQADLENPTNFTSGLNLLVDEYVVDMSLGVDSNLVLTSTGRVLSWGSNGDGQLGDGTNTTSTTPIDITSQFGLNVDEEIVLINASNYTCIATTSTGRVFTWGYNESGQLGNGTLISSSIPVDITINFTFNVGEEVTEIASGESFFIVRTTMNRVFGFGYNEDGQLGTGDRIWQNTPYDMTSIFALDISEDITAIAASAYNSFVLTTERVLIWGYNAEGQLGDGTNQESFTPVDISDKFNYVTILQNNLMFDEIIVDIAMGDYHYIAVTSYGRVFVWGRNEEGQLGTGDNIDQPIPVDITPYLYLDINEKVIAASAGEEHSMILTDFGTVYTWGNNEHGQLGDNTLDNSNTPIELSSTAFNDEQVVTISAGGDLCSAITIDNSVYTWGFNPLGQMGDGTLVSKHIPTDVTSQFPLVLDEYVIEVTFGLYHTLAITNQGRLFTYGYNNNGQLGTGVTSTTPVSIPTELPASNFGGHGIVTSAAGYSHSVVLADNGAVYTWGYNGGGNLGDGTYSTRTAPYLIPDTEFNSETIVDVAAGFDFTYTITDFGDVYSFGRNTNGQLCDGTNYTRQTPVKSIDKLDEKAISKVVAGRYSALGITNAGEFYRWGRKPEGTIATSNQYYDMTPIQNFYPGTIEMLYSPFEYDAFSDTITVTILPKYDIGYHLYSVTINGTEYLSDSFTVTNGRIDVEIDISGVVYDQFLIELNSFSFQQGFQMDVNGMTTTVTELYDYDPPTFDPITNINVEVGSSPLDLESLLLNLQDNSGETPNVNVVESINYEFLGTYTVFITVSDNYGNSVIEQFEVNVIDTTAPIITLVGEDTIYLEVGNTYTEQGATVTDNYDVLGSPEISGDTVDTTSLGVYTVLYNITDLSGNDAVEVTRTVYITDDTAPVITLNGESTVYIEVGDSYTELGATYTDNYYPSGNAVISGDTVDTNTIGTYIVNYDIEDESGNIATMVSRTVIVEDTISPSVSGVQDEEIYDKGTEVTIEFDEGTATLNGEQFNSGDTVVEPGEYILIVTDASGNTTTTQFQIEGGVGAIIYIVIGAGLVLIGGGVFIAFKKGIFG